MATYINDPRNTVIYLTNAHSSEGDVPQELGQELVRMVLGEANYKITHVSYTRVSSRNVILRERSDEGSV